MAKTLTLSSAKTIGKGAGQIIEVGYTVFDGTARIEGGVADFFPGPPTGAGDGLDLSRADQTKVNEVYDAITAALKAKKGVP